MHVKTINISVDFASNVRINVHKFTEYTHSLFVTKNDLSWLNNLFMARLQLNRMSSFAKNKHTEVFQSLNIRVDVAKSAENFSQIHTVHSLFVC